MGPRPRRDPFLMRLAGDHPGALFASGPDYLRESTLVAEMHRDEIARLPTTLTSLHCIGHLRQSTTLCRSPASLVVDDFVFSARSSAPHVRQISKDVAPFRAPRSDAQPQPLTRAPAAIVHRPRARASRPKALRSGRGCNHSFPPLPLLHHA
jgi:hypothetical protein